MTEGTQLGTGIAGTLRSVDGTGVVRMERRYDTSVEDLWSALTEPDRLARWVAEVDGDLTLGGHFQVMFTSGWEGPGRVDECDRPHRLVLTMSPGQEDQTVISAELSVIGDQSSLIIEERGLPLRELAAHGAGWQAHIEDLSAHLAGQRCMPWHTRWTELAPTYQAMTISAG